MADLPPPRIVVTAQTQQERTHILTLLTIGLVPRHGPAQYRRMDVHDDPTTNTAHITLHAQEKQ